MNRIPALDGWRGIAIMLVLVEHAGIMLDRYRYIAFIGQHGVAIFFVLSGFLITSSLLHEKETTGRINLRKFYLRRFFRLMPCAWFFLLCVFILCMRSPVRPLALPNILAAVLFVRNYMPSIEHDLFVTGHFWSLSIEGQFYLVWPSILILAGARRARWIAIAGAMLIAFYRWDHWTRLERLTFRHLSGTHLRGDAILIGCATALFMPTLRPYLRNWMAFPLVSGLVWCMFHYHKLIPLHESFIIALLLAVTTSTDSALFGALDWKPLAFIGTISYSIYVWQQLVVVEGLNNRSMQFAAPFLLLAISLYSYYRIEQPFIAKGRTLIESQRAPEPVTA
jgi:peptidoglycan/LPS O-acetylase OafA/YrhL